MARWGFTPFPKNWSEVIDRIYLKDVYGQAARELGLPDTVDEQVPVKLFDGVVFNPNDPLSYLEGLAIRQEIRIDGEEGLRHHAPLPVETMFTPLKRAGGHP